MRRLFSILMTAVVFGWCLNAQARTVSGTVLDATNHEPLIGATIMPIGGGQGASADIDGNFTLNVPDDVKKAKVSYVGYEPKTVDLTDGMTVYLSTSGTDLQDVVVVAYGTATKESLTGSVAVVSSKEIDRRPVSNVATALEGNAPGVIVSSSTAAGPGGSPSILVRGINTVNGTNEPLYVVDGVVYSGSISDINPDDVESMSVLKDAASCALYGSKGANGVILITTRKGKQIGKVNVNLKISEGLYQRGLPFYDRLSTNQWMETRLTSMINQQASTNPFLTYDQIKASEIEHFFDNSTAWNVYGDVPATEIFNSDGKVVLNPLAKYTDLDWWDSLSQNGYRQEYNVSLSGASEKYNFYASMAYLKAQGYVIESDFERYSSRFNLNANPVKYFRMSANASVSYQNSKEADVDTDNLDSTTNPFHFVNRAPVLPYYNHDPKTGDIIYDENGVPEWNFTKGYGTIYDSNIAYLTRANKHEYNSLYAHASISGTAILPYGFELTVRGDMARTMSKFKTFMNPFHGSASGVNGTLTLQNYRTKTHNFMQTLTWEQEYGNHHIDLLLDHENYSYDYSLDQQAVSGMVYTTGALELTNFSTSTSFKSSVTQRTTESYLGRARYNYDQKYFAEASLRRDGTSRFAKRSRWGTFWSLGASWILSKEKFLQNADWLNYLKLRASYGTAGSDAAAGAYAYWSTYGTVSQRLNNLVLNFPSQLGNDLAKWENVSTLDIAVESTMLDNRLNLSIGYFLKKNSDLLYNVGQPISAGGSWSGKPWSILTNIGTMQNWGWEIGINGDIISTKDFKWHANIDASIIKNKLIKLSDNGDQWYETTALLKGKTRYEWYMPTYAGVDNATGRALYEINPNSHTFQTLQDGEWVYSQDLWDNNLAAAKKVNALVEIDGKYYTNRPTYASSELHGTSLPTVFGSFGTSFSWKGISLNALFTYSLGGKLYDSTYKSLMSYDAANTTNYHKDILKAWTAVPEGFDTSNETMMNSASARINKNVTPQVNADCSTYDNGISSRWLTSASYMQFKNLSVGYDFPECITKPLRLEGLNVNFLAENLFTVTARKGINPASSYSGNQYDYFVVARTFTFQLGFRF